MQQIWKKNNKKGWRCFSFVGISTLKHDNWKGNHLSSKKLNSCDHTAAESWQKVEKNVQKFCWRFCPLQTFPDENSKKLKSIAWGFLRKNTFNTMHRGIFLDIMLYLLTCHFYQKMFGVKVFQYKISNRMSYYQTFYDNLKKFQKWKI